MLGAAALAAALVSLYTWFADLREVRDMRREPHT
jgi:hypothetical protein